MRSLLLCAGLLAAAAGPAAADSSYAIVVGANQGGAGQVNLKFAEDDARRMSDLLTELGGYAADDIAIVVRPDPAAVLTAIDAVATRVAADHAAGTTSTVFFYYSGHAKASALNLGGQELELGALREKLLALPSTLTVVVLDACQSGAFSRIKGAEPAADFSFNSKSRLDATGVAVLASSTGSELSQESDVLGSSYFTHHLLVGLRGAADVSKDGRVTIDEAYRYAYHQTLLATAATAVGSQHVSLEVDLKGHGEVPLSYPAKATAQLELPAELAGNILIERIRARAVIAEIHKVAGESVKVAIAAGDYRVIIRHDRVVERCPVVVHDGGSTVLELDRCVLAPLEKTTPKYPHVVAVFADGRRLTMELSAGVGSDMEDAYTDRLADFGYTKPMLGLGSRITASGRWRHNRTLQLGATLGFAASPEYTRGDDDTRLSFSWLTTTLVGFARADATLWTPRLRPYVQAGAGVGLARTELVDEMGVDHHENHVGPVLTGAAGVELTTRFWPRFGLSGQYSFVFAPILTNLAGDRHLGVGHFIDLSVHYRF